MRILFTVLLSALIPLPLLADPTPPPANPAKLQQSVARPKASPRIKKLKPAQAERLSRMAMEYGQRMLRSKRYEVAIKQLRTAHKLNRKNLECTALLIQAHSTLNQWPEAAAYGAQLHQARCPLCLDGVLMADWPAWVDRMPPKKSKTDLPPAPAE